MNNKSLWTFVEWLSHGEVVMLKLVYLCATAIIMISFSRVAGAQNPPQIPYQSPGVYSTYNNQTYGPHGDLQINQGNQTYTQRPNGSGPTYSTYGYQTYGSDGSVWKHHLPKQRHHYTEPG
jgi:hypothetical protein